MHFKIYIYILILYLLKFFSEVLLFVSSFENEEKIIFNKFLKYYSKTWLKTKFIHFDLAYSENWTCRTNNLYEAFHNTLTYNINANIEIMLMH